MICVALGANRPGAWGTPEAALIRAVESLDRRAGGVAAVSPLYATSPLGPTAQPPYLNAVVTLADPPPPAPLLALLHRIEKQAGRVRGRRWGARTLDLDLIAYRRIVRGWQGAEQEAVAAIPLAPPRGQLLLPHPRAHLRPFVMAPIADLAPLWHHPVLGLSADLLWRRLKLARGGAVLDRLRVAGWPG